MLFRPGRGRSRNDPRGAGFRRGGSTSHIFSGIHVPSSDDVRVWRDVLADAEVDTQEVRGCYFLRDVHQCG
jgi:hypothetical protein